MVAVGGISVAVAYTGFKVGTNNVERAVWQADRMIPTTAMDDRLHNRLDHLKF